jgi:hypothetical protein
MLAFYKQFGQGISVGLCALMSGCTLTYMVNDIHSMEKKQIRNDYEKQIKVLNEEIEKLRFDRATMNHKLNLKY